MVVGDDVELATDSRNTRRQLRNVAKIVRHKYHDPDFQSNNIALLILANPFVLTPTFGPVNVTDVAPVDNEPCRVGK